MGGPGVSEITPAGAAALPGLDDLPPGTRVEHDAFTTMTRVRFLFPNGLGVSVVRGAGSYGAEEGLLETAVLPEIGDPAGWRTFEDVRALVWHVAAQPPSSAPARLDGAPVHPTFPGDEGW